MLCQAPRVGHCPVKEKLRLHASILISSSAPPSYPVRSSGQSQGDTIPVQDAL